MGVGRASGASRAVFESVAFIRSGRLYFIFPRGSTRQHGSFRPMSARSRVPEQPHRAAFLDRDGVLVEILRDAELGILYSAFHPDQLQPTKNAAEAVRRLRALGYECIVVTNQPGAAKGHFPI